MKKIITLSFIATLFFTVANAQQDTSWHTGGIAALNFNQTNLTNWAAGGENSLAATSLVSVFAKYKKQRASWDNSLDLAYGLLKSGENSVRKNEDKIDLLSKYGYDLKDKSKFAYAALFNFKSQFDNSYNYNADNTKTIISQFAAPAYILFALGIDYKPSKDLSIFLSPLTSKTIIVNNQDLADAGSFGVDPAEYKQINDTTQVKIKDGKKSKSEFGAYLNARFQKEVAKNVNFLTKLDLFSNYEENPQNIVINWEVLLAMRVNKYLSASISTQLIYDDNINIQQYESKNGFLIPKLNPSGKPISGPRVQFKEVIGIGLAYKF